MPIGSLHRLEDGIDERLRYLLVKEVAHRVDEDASRLAPSERLL